MHLDCFTLLLMRSNDIVITSPLYIYTLFFIATAPITIIAQDQSAWLWVLLIGPPWPNYFWLGPYPWLHWNRVPWSVWPLLKIRASTGPDPGSFYCGHLKSLCHSMHLHLFIASIVHELCYPQCVGAGFSSSYLPYSIWPSISSFCLPESSEGMTSLYSVPIIRSHKTCPPSTVWPHVQHTPPICRQFNYAVANVCIYLFVTQGSQSSILWPLPLNTLLSYCQQHVGNPTWPKYSSVDNAISIKHSISGSCRFTDVPDLGVWWLCLAYHVARPCVYEPTTLCSFHTHLLPATLHLDLKKQLFVRSSMHSFAHGGVVNTLASYYHVALPQTTSSWYGECPSWPLPTMVFIQTTPFVWPQMRLSMLHYYPCKPYVEIPVFLYPMVFSWVFTENLFPHFLFPKVPKMLFPKMFPYPIFGQRMTIVQH